MRILKGTVISTIFLLLATSTASGVLSAQDAEISVTPVSRQFPVTTLSTESAAATFTISNHHPSATRTLGEIVLAGIHADEFVIGAHDCSFKTLQPHETCTVPVSFRPLRRGTKLAELRIPSDDTETPVLTAFVTNRVSTVVEAQNRMPPVLASCSIPEFMQAGQTYTLSWTLEGYHDNYTSYVVLFDCTGETDCGASYSDVSRFAQAPAAYATEISSGNWDYIGAETKSFHYQWQFAVPATREDGSPWAEGGTDVVMRIYRKSNLDVERNNGSISLLIPGDQSERYYDTTGRRVLKSIVP